MEDTEDLCDGVGPEDSPMSCRQQLQRSMSGLMQQWFNLVTAVIKRSCKSANITHFFSFGCMEIGVFINTIYTMCKQDYFFEEEK